MRRIYKGLTILGLVIIGVLAAYGGFTLLEQSGLDRFLAGFPTEELAGAPRYPVPPRPETTEKSPAPRRDPAPAGKRTLNPPSKKTVKRSPQQVASPDGRNTVYKWVDANGTVHFSDHGAPANAERIASVPVPTYDFPKPDEAAVDREVEEADTVTEVDVRRPPIMTAGFGARPSFRNVKMGDDRFLTGDGYRVEAAALHAGGTLSFQGRVANGPACGDLLLKGLLYSGAGRTVRLVAHAADVGSSSGMFESETTTVGADNKGWKVISVEADCQDR